MNTNEKDTMLRWLPIEGDLRDRAANVLACIAEHYKVPSEVSQKSQNSILKVDGFEVERWIEESLSNGFPGICLFMGQLDQLEPDAGWDLVGHLYLKELQHKLEDTGLRDLSLYGGLSGILIAIRSLSRKGTRYQSMIDQVATWMESLATQKVKELITQWEKKSLQIGDYDTIIGLSGIGRIVLSFYDRPGMREVWHHIVTWFQLYCRQKSLGSEIVPGWHISTQNQFLAQEEKKYPNGNFNLGLSHGISGPIALMSISILKGVSSEELRNEVNELTHWLVKWKVEGEEGIYWPGRVSYEEWKQGRLYAENKLFPRDSWCYGAPGIARSIWLAGQALQNEEWSLIALQAYMDMEERIEDNGGMISATLCHGLAGWLHLIQRMYSETGEPKLGLMRDRLVKKVLDFYDPSSAFGYYDKNLIDENMLDIDEAGLLNGASGVAIVLASLLSNESPEWDQILLIR